MPTDKTRRFGKYELKREIGHGAMGTVYLAEDETCHREVALKVLSAGVAANGRYTRRFLSEARLATQLNHPNIVNVRDYGQQDGHYYLAMDYVPGQSCKARIHERGKLPWRDAVRIAIEVAKGLASAAGQGIIHRDIKPENILLNGDESVQIADLGLAKEADVFEPLPSDTSLGTPDYMSPEQVSNSETVDFRSDIYALGATLFHMICAKAPYTGRSAYEVMVKHVSAELPSPRRYVPDLPQHVCDVMRKMMARDAADRYQSYPALLADLEALLTGAQVTASQFDDESLLGTNGAPDVAAPARKRTLLWVAAALPVLAGIGLAIYLIVTR
jgi:serine/threonine-protein kinase